MAADLGEYFGPLIVDLGAVGLIVFLASSWRKPVGVASLALLASITLYLTSLYAGQTVIYLPGVTPGAVPNPLFNVRYATSAALPLAIFLAHMIQRLQLARWAPKVVAPMLLATVIMSQTVLTAQSALSRSRTVSQDSRALCSGLWTSSCWSTITAAGC
jgi:hypothetical protein